MDTLKCFNKKTLVAATASVVLGMGIAGNASAAAIAYSKNDIFDFLITPSTPFSSITSATTSKSAGTLDGAGNAFSDPLDALQAGLGAGLPGGNSFGITPGFPGNDFGRGDAQIVNPDVLTAPGGRALNVAEVQLPSGGVHNGTGEASNQLSADFSFVLGASGTLTFDFKSIPLMLVQLTDTNPLNAAQAALQMNITIRDPSGATVFLWNPNGIIGDAFGGTDGTDDASLNLSIAQIVNVGSDSHDPLSTDLDCGGGNCDYSAITDPLTGGTLYTLSISMVETAAAQVPEPGTMFLLGGGLAGLAFASRRRAAAKAL